ncbi:synaptotagmin-10 [Crotalus adamanteus]|uniref:Synaptotagmin-10 n=1 Tax=Crotalus adamanteus TaxID=8729 RepID=A0AAW1BFG0_CROAD
MSFPKEDGVSGLCHKALQIISELCLGGQVELEKCSGIFPLETSSQGISRTGRVSRQLPRSSRSPSRLLLPSPAARVSSRPPSGRALRGKAKGERFARTWIAGQGPGNPGFNPKRVGRREGFTSQVTRESGRRRDPLGISNGCGEKQRGNTW